MGLHCQSHGIQADPSSASINSLEISVARGQHQGKRIEVKPVSWLAHLAQRLTPNFQHCSSEFPFQRSNVAL